MNLAELKNIATVDTGFVTKTVTWEKNTFDIQVKKDMSAADFEFIQFGETPKPKRDENGKVIKDSEGNTEFQTDDEASTMARRVSRLVKLGDGESIPYEDAKQFKWSLLVALVNAQSEAENPLPEGDEVKKD